MIEEYDVSSGLSSKSVVQDNQFQKTFEKNRFQLDLRTIRESPETVYTVSYMETTEDHEEGDEAAVLVPPVEPAVPGVSIIELSESSEEEDLRRLNERADKLSKELKELNNQAQADALKDSIENDDADPSTPVGDFKEIMRQYSDFIIIIQSDETGTEETIEHATTDLSTLLTEEVETEKEVVDDDDLERKNDHKVLEVEQITQEESPTMTEFLPKPEEMSQDQVTKTDDDNDKKKTIATEKVEAEAGDQETKTDDDKKAVGTEIKEEEAEDQETKTGDGDDKKAVGTEIEEGEAEVQKTKTDNGDGKKKAIRTEKEEVEVEENQEELESLLHQLEHFKPQRPQVPQPQFPDLDLEGETSLRQKCHGQGHFWRMPFRHQLFGQQIQ